MTSKGLEVIDHTVQLTHEWINELTERLDWSNHKDALRLMRVTLTSLRDHLRHEEAIQLGAQFPLLIRGMYYEGWKLSVTPSKDRHLASFVAGIEKHVGNVMEYRGVQDIVAVFKLLNARITPGEIADVLDCLPREIREIWPE